MHIFASYRDFSEAPFSPVVVIEMSAKDYDELVNSVWFITRFFWRWPWRRRLLRQYPALALLAHAPDSKDIKNDGGHVFFDNESF